MFKYLIVFYNPYLKRMMHFTTYARGKRSAIKQVLEDFRIDIEDVKSIKRVICPR